MVRTILVWGIGIVDFVLFFFGQGDYMFIVYLLLRCRSAWRRR
jgi:hypothetical protein